MHVLWIVVIAAMPALFTALLLERERVMWAAMGGMADMAIPAPAAPRRARRTYRRSLWPQIRAPGWICLFLALSFAPAQVQGQATPPASQPINRATTEEGK